MTFLQGRAPLLGALMGLLHGSDGDDAIVVQLDDQPIGRAETVFPHDDWRPLGPELVLAGRTFAVERSDRGRVSIDTTGDGRPDKRVTGMGGVITLRVQEDGADPFRYGIRIDKTGGLWRWSPAWARVGRLAGTTITIHDLDRDGTYDDYGRDAMVVGKARGASFLSRVVSVDGALYSFDISEDGRRAVARPYVGPIAHLDVVSGFTCAGELTAALFASGADVSFDLAAAADGMDVPCGEYRLVSGRVEKGLETAEIGVGRSSPITLRAGERVALDWGGPIVGEFGMRRCGDRLTILPDVRLFGRAMEEYMSFRPVAAAPRIEVRDKESGHLLQYGNLGGCCGGGFSACVLDVPADAELEVKLVHERELFGVIVGHPR